MHFFAQIFSNIRFYIKAQFLAVRLLLTLPTVRKSTIAHGAALAVPLFFFPWLIAMKGCCVMGAQILMSDFNAELRGEVAGLKHVFEDRLWELVVGIGERHAAGADNADLLTRAMRVGALSTGKRMRPLLMMLIGRDLACTSTTLLDAACAVELVHAASLVLDDLPCMDDATLRRGRPAVHVHFGEDVAILASVALLSKAFAVLAATPVCSPTVRTRLISLLATAVGEQGLVKGQFQDLHGAGSERSDVEIAETNALKTGSLFNASVAMTAVIAGANDVVAQSLQAFARAAGQAFQIKDDLQDVPGNDSAVTGKDVGNDEGKATLLVALGAIETQRRLAIHVREADQHLVNALGEHSETRRFVRSLFAKEWDMRSMPSVRLRAGVGMFGNA
jgi:geranylgeranyl diphosphate synthase, type II